MLKASNVNTDAGNKPKKTSQYVSFGIKELTIKDIQFKEASTGSLRLEYKVESTPIIEEGWVGVDGASGQIGTVLTSWAPVGSKNEEEVFGQLITICKKMGLDVDSFPEFNTIKDAVTHILPLMKGKFVRVKLVAKYYMGKDKEGKPKEKFNLHFARYQFAESMDIPNKESRLRFDENSKYDIDKSEIVKETTQETPVTDDLPF